MAHYRKGLMVSWIAMAISLGACGGGGGGGGGIASVPPPPAIPAPTPTPTPTPAATIGAPALAVAPNANLFPGGRPGEATIQNHSTTVFPLLESVMSISPGRVVADTTTMNAGATLTSNSTADSYEFSLGNTALGVSSVVLTPTNSGSYTANLASGARVSLGIADPATSNLSYTSYGSWAVTMANGSLTQGQYVTGYATVASYVPQTGTASYRGSVTGQVMLPQAGRENGVNYAALSGTSELAANFASGSITGSLTNMVATDVNGTVLPWNSVSLLAAISGGVFTGTTAATSAPSNSASLSGSSTGTLAGMFFGPSAQELGAVWTLSDGVGAALGSFGASTSAFDPCAGCWDY